MSYPKKSVAPKRSLIPNQIYLTELSPDPFQFFFASSLLSFINKSNFLVSIVNDLFLKYLQLNLMENHKYHKV